MKILILLFLLVSLHVNAQQIDSLIKQEDDVNRISLARKLRIGIIPVVFMAYGFSSLGESPIRNLDFSTKAELTEDNPLFSTHIDDYSKFAPLVAMYGLEMAGIKGKNNAIDQTAMVLITTAITTTVVTDLKKWTHRLRPNGSGYSSFPSGHTATAFAAAELLKQEFKDRSPWLSYAGYAVATVTGCLRMYNNAHWMSDVIAGAGIGMLSTKLTYLLYPKLQKLLGIDKKNLTFSPNYQQGRLGYSINYRL